MLTLSLLGRGRIQAVLNAVRKDCGRSCFIYWAMKYLHKLFSIYETAFIDIPGDIRYHNIEVINMATNYFEERLDGQMKFYSKKSAEFQKEYYRLSIAAIVINAVVPVMAIGIDSEGALKYVIAAFSAAASILSSILLLRKPKEIWLKYRSTYEKLKKEKILFLTGSGKYKTCTEDDFIQACEQIMEAEHIDWEKLHRDPAKDDKN